MRTFPKSLAAFRALVENRGKQLRKLSLEELKKLGAAPAEQLTFESRPATISILVQESPRNGIRVVVQGFMKARYVPGKHVALDGFYKNADGTVTPIADEELDEFD